MGAVEFYGEVVTTPDISILVATSDSRRPFWPWLAADIARQTIFQQGTSAEVIVCGSHEAFELLTRELRDLPIQVRYTFRARNLMAESNEIARKRQALLEEARGAFVCWMDDDDYHHPDWLSWSIAQLLVRGTIWHTFSGIVHYDVMHDRYWLPKSWSQHPIPIMTVTRGVPLDMDLSKDYAEDVDWFTRLSVFRGQTQDLSAPPIMALVHPYKTSKWLLEPRTQEAFKPGLPPFLEPDETLLPELRRLRDRIHAAQNIREIKPLRRA